MKLRNSLSGLMLLSLSIALSAPVQAGVVTLGLPAMANTGNCDPFGCAAFFGLGTYQQVYTRSAFAGPITIDQITFFDSVVHNSGQPSDGDYTLDLSYTAMPLGGLDLQNPNDDVTAGFQSFFTGGLPALSGGHLTFSGSPFTYNPADGNLLLTITVSNPSDNYPPLYLDQSSSTSQTTNAYFGTYLGQQISGGNVDGGLVTQFTYTSPSGSVPEPASWLLLLSGIACVAAKARRAINRTLL